MTRTSALPLLARSDSAASGESRVFSDLGQETSRRIKAGPLISSAATAERARSWGKQGRRTGCSRRLSPDEAACLAAGEIGRRSPGGRVLLFSPDPCRGIPKPVRATTGKPCAASASRGGPGSPAEHRVPVPFALVVNALVGEQITSLSAPAFRWVGSPVETRSQLPPPDLPQAE